ncbi:MAG: hypothetical protein AAFU73_20795 [Planctomycetota bacterium]
MRALPVAAARAFPTAAVLALVATNASAQCLGDRWESPIQDVPFGVAPIAAQSGERTFLPVLQPNPALGPASLAILVTRYDSVTGTHRIEERLKPPAWDPSISTLNVPLRCIDAEGTTLAAIRRSGFGEPDVVDVFERGPAGWTYSALPVPGFQNLHTLVDGQRCAISGSTLAVLDVGSSGMVGSPFTVDFFERSPSGVWGPAQHVVLMGTRSFYAFWYPACVALDGDVAAVAMVFMFPYEAVLVLERDSAGQWAHSATLPPSGASEHHGFEYHSRVAVSGDRIACLRYRPGDFGELRTTVYERDPSGAWSAAQTLVTRDPRAASVDASQLRGSVRFDGDVLAVHCGDVVELYEPGPTGLFAPTRQILGLGELASFESEGIVGFGIGIGAQGPPPPLDVRGMRRAGSGVAGVNVYCPERGEPDCNAQSPFELAWFQPDPVTGPLIARADLSGLPPGSHAALFASSGVEVQPTALGDLCLDGRRLVRLGSLRTADALGCAFFQVPSAPIVPFMGGTLHAQALVLGSAGALSPSVRVQQ